MLEGLDSRDYTELMAAVGLLLLPDERADLRTAISTFHTVGNANAELTDYMIPEPAYDDAPEEQSEEEMKLALARMGLVFNGR
ncbi:MAG: hypothetical protein JWO31_3639 [Phycisphaerales bacterium]|nr:hypothetical protein [Phycisphaerales bacterium]